MKYFFTFLYILFVLGCSSSKHFTSASKITQGIEGYVREIKGNQMPSPDVKPALPKGISTTIYIYELTNINQTERISTSAFYQNIRTKFIQSILSDSSGHFVVSLPPGDYSLFTKEKGKYYANNFDSNNNIAPAKVEKSRLTKINILISAEATY